MIVTGTTNFALCSRLVVTGDIVPLQRKAKKSVSDVRNNYVSSQNAIIDRRRDRINLCEVLLLWLFRNVNCVFYERVLTVDLKRKIKCFSPVFCDGTKDDSVAVSTGGRVIVCLKVLGEPENVTNTNILW